MEVYQYRQYFLKRSCDYEHMCHSDMNSIDVLGGHCSECINKFMKDNFKSPFFIQSNGTISWDSSVRFQKHYSDESICGTYKCLYSPIILSDFKLKIKYPGYTKFTQYCIGWFVNTISGKRWYPVFSHDRGKNIENVNKDFKITYQNYINRLYVRILKQIFIDDLAYYIRDFII